MKTKLKKAIYEKTFARDFTLPLIEIWCDSEAADSKIWTNNKQPFQPFLVFHRHQDETVYCYMDKRGITWMENELSRIIGADENFIKHVADKWYEYVKDIKDSYIPGNTLSKQELLGYFNNLRIGWGWYEVGWWLMEMLHEQKNDKFSLLQEARVYDEDSTPMVEDTIRSSLEALFPEIKNYIHLLRIEEIASGKIPPVDMLKKRAENYIYVSNTLHVGKNLEYIEDLFGIIIEKPIQENIQKIQGSVAYNGKIQGMVKRMMTARNLENFQKGEILVTAMTTPDFLPALKKASAFITDEGGITCHAAIVARELKKPCIIGTKIATQVLKDGDMVEVDADNGIVKIIKKAE